MMAVAAKRTYLPLKIIVVGDSQCGKSCLLGRFARHFFDEESQPTLGVEFHSKAMGWTRSCDCERLREFANLQIWDTAGIELFHSVIRGYYRGTVGAVICFDLANADSFKNVASWIKDVKEGARPDVVIVLAGMKCDREDRVVSVEEAEQFANCCKLLYAETSARTGAGVNEVFEALVRYIEENIGNGTVAALP